MLIDDPVLNKLYNVRVPLIYTYEDWEVDVMGVPTNESCKYSFRNGSMKITSSSAHKDLTNCYLSLYKIIKIANAGGTVWFVNHTDIENVFITIEDLIRRYEQHSQGLNAFIESGRDSILNEIKTFSKTIFENNNLTIHKEVEKVIKSDKFGLGNRINKPTAVMNTNNAVSNITVNDVRNNRYRKTIIPVVPYPN